MHPFGQDVLRGVCHLLHRKQLPLRIPLLLQASPTLKDEIEEFVGNKIEPTDGQGRRVKVSCEA